VTVARKRSEAEAVQDVPIAVTAYGAEQIEALFVQKLDDLSHLMPNVQLEQIGTFPGVQSFSIRGQGINSSIPSVDPTVGVFIDGQYLGTTFGVVVDTFDLESIEVLRGPQGLLFGRNVTGGAVLLRNARPTGEFGFKAKLGVTDEDETTIAAAVEGSLIDDRLDGKIAIYQNDDQGYFRNNNQSASPPAPVPGVFYFNPASSSTAGEMKTTLVRPVLVYTPNNRTELTLIAESGKSDGDGAVWTSVTAQQAGALPYFETTLDEVGYTDLKWNQAMLELSVDGVFDGALTNILAWRDVDAESATDIDGTNLPIFMAVGNTDSTQFSNELRWSGSLADNWDATIGLYHFDMDLAYDEGRYIFAFGLLRALGGRMDSRNTGVFWNNDFHFGDRWTLQAGLRYTNESKDARIVTEVCGEVVTFDCPLESFSGDWSNITPKLGLERVFGENVRLYGFWSKGFRSGGFNFRNAKPLVIPAGPTSEEETNTFEVGIKSELMDGRVRLNVAAFHNEIDDIQRELNIGDPDVAVLQGTINAGDVTIEGLEIDFVALLTDTFSINASFGWQDGEYDRVDPLVGDIQALLPPTTPPLLGSDLPRLAPKNSSVGFSWDIPLGGVGLLNVAASYSYRDANFYDDSNLGLFPVQERTNASINYLSRDDRWRVSLYGKNLSDEPNWGNLTSIAGLYTAGPMQKGKRLGLEINYRTN
jgi:iron complex outermembrane receptor protein